MVFERADLARDRRGRRRGRAGGAAGRAHPGAGPAAPSGASRLAGARRLASPTPPTRAFLAGSPGGCSAARGWSSSAVVGAAASPLALPALRLRLSPRAPSCCPPAAPQRVFFDDLARDYPAASAPGRSRSSAATRGRGDGLGPTPGPAGRRRPWTPPPGSADRRSTSACAPPPADRRRRPGAGHEIRGDRRAVPDLGHRPGRALIDFTASIVGSGRRIAVGLVALATFVLLFLMTGSVLCRSRRC